MDNRAEILRKVTFDLSGGQEKVLMVALTPEGKRFELGTLQLTLTPEYYEVEVIMSQDRTVNYICDNAGAGLVRIRCSRES